MTSQTLMPSRSSDMSTAQAFETAIGSKTVERAASSSGTSTALLETQKLPYQVDHQVELLHLRAEVEALLQELQTIKQRRADSDQQI